MRESQNLCSHCVEKLHETTQMLVTIDYIMEMTVNNSCKYGDMGRLNICSSYLFIYFIHVSNIWIN